MILKVRILGVLEREYYSYFITEMLYEEVNKTF
jgi:hypothetical protein